MTWAVLASLLVGAIGGAATVYVGKLAARTGKEANDWQRITGLWGRVETLERKVEHLQGQNDQHTAQITRLKEALAAARRYVTDLISLLRLHDITPPDPPSDYTTD